MATMIPVKVGQDIILNGSLVVSGTTTPVNLTSCRIRMQVRDEAYHLVATCDTSLSNGSATITDHVNGLFTLDITNAITLEWLPGTQLAWDVWLVDSGQNRHPIGAGFFNVLESQTLF